MQSLYLTEEAPPCRTAMAGRLRNHLAFHSLLQEPHPRLQLPLSLALLPAQTRMADEAARAKARGAEAAAAAAVSAAAVADDSGHGPVQMSGGWVQGAAGVS